MSPAVFGGLMNGLRGLSAQSSSLQLLQANAAAAAATQWQRLPQVFQSKAHVQQAQQQQQPGGSRSLSFLSAAGALQRSAGIPADAASPIQQLNHAQRFLALSLQQSLQQQQHWEMLPQQQHMLGQQLRHFVLMPRRVKYRKAHKSMGFNETICGNTRQLAFGLYGIRALEHCRMPAATLEAVRRTLRRTIKKSAMMWIRATPNVPVTSKPAEVRMGKGKGTLDYWAAPIRAGQILFEFDRCSKATAMQAVQAIKPKMPIKVDFVEWN